MVEFLDLLLLVLALALASAFALGAGAPGLRTFRRVKWSVAPAVFLGCVLIAVILHEPVPRIHDEFSYALMGDTLAHGHVANAAPPLPEFFDTFHVFVHPVYASKYFPAQGIFLAVGERLTGHPAVGDCETQASSRSMLLIDDPFVSTFNHQTIYFTVFARPGSVGVMSLDFTVTLAHETSGYWDNFQWHGGHTFDPQ